MPKALVQLKNQGKIRVYPVNPASISCDDKSQNFVRNSTTKGRSPAEETKIPVKPMLTGFEFSADRSDPKKIGLVLN